MIIISIIISISSIIINIIIIITSIISIIIINIISAAAWRGPRTCAWGAVGRCRRGRREGPARLAWH